MASTAPTVEAIKAGFPHPSVPRKPGEPTYESIHAVHALLKANAASVPSELGGGVHGLLGLTLANTTYTPLAGQAFTRPANPGLSPTIPARSTGETVRRIERQHREVLRTYHEVLRTDSALRQQLLSAFDDMYLKANKQPHVGYSNRTTLVLLQHLYANYGLISQMDLDENETRMKAPYDSTTPIENLFSQIDESIEYADNGNSPFTNIQVVTNAYILVFNTGQLERACDEWDAKLEADKTWINFKTHFRAAHQRYMKQQRLRQSHFNTHQGHANALQVQEETQHQTALALQSLANATSDDRNAVANLSLANKELTTHLEAMTTKVTSLETKVSQLESKIDKLITLASKRITYDRSSTHYCWTHGRTFNSNHTSKNCTQRKDGHKENATLNTRLGGSDRNCNLNN